MKYLLNLVILVFLMNISLNAQELKTREDSLAYAFGLDLAREIQNKGMSDLDTKVMLQAVNDVIKSNDLKMNPVDARTYIAKEKRARKERISRENRLAGVKFLEEKSKEEGVMALSDGIYYEILEEGTGPKPPAGSNVTLHYEGRLITGEVFDSSYERGAPASFSLNRLIKGWQVAVPNMPEGSKWRIYIPQEMAYGQRGAGAKIKPYSALVFDIELIANK